ncbi:MAG: iron export ABC transporter permease subunit FetB [SAR324 cluster bacterium]|nr:iron export ABC transporter permease subunit FetB [SAR324 cluster bacterium]MBF0349584.1 iron export ABC transporter permease subunit FetB [SAR324 cluster bacterium]
MNYISIHPLQLGLALLLLLGNLGLSLMLKLKLERSLGIAVARMTIQLLLVGMILEWIFALRSFIWVMVGALIMTTIASISAVNRTKRRFPGIYWHSFVSILGSAFIVTGIGLTGIIQVTPWYEPRYFFPIFGMILGNILNGISLGLDRFMEEIVTHRDKIETSLALGATRWEAIQETMRNTLRTGMIPILNTMMIAGVVSLPGMMTGQILSGTPPIEAVRYQIVIMVLIASAVAFGLTGVILLAFFRLFTPQHQLREDLLISK